MVELSDAPAARVRLVGAALAGCLIVAVAASRGRADALAIDIESLGGPGGEWWYWAESLAVTATATVAGLALLRYWPRLVGVGALLALGSLLAERGLPTGSHQLLVQLDLVSGAAAPLAVLGVLAAAQALARDGRVGAGAAVAAGTIGARVLGTATLGRLVGLSASLTWHLVLVVAALGAALPAVLAPPTATRADAPAAEPADPGTTWGRIRLVVAGGLAVGAGVLPGVFTAQRLAGLLDVSLGALDRHRFAVAAIVGLLALLVGLAAALLAGVPALAGALVVAVGQVAVAAPLLLAGWALTYSSPLRFVAALGGVALGLLAAATRWRVPVAAAGAVLSAAGLVIAYSATTGAPEKLMTQRDGIPAALLLVVIGASATALLGGAAPVLARHRVLPVALGPLAATLALGGGQVLQVTYVGRDGQPGSSLLNPVHHLTTSAILLLVAAAGLVGLHLAEALAVRRGERRAAETIRRQAAAAERDRLARPIHDGVLQVLALMQRYGPELGDQGRRLAELAGIQNSALRALITSEPAHHDRTGTADLVPLVASLAAPTVDIAVPADPVPLPAHDAWELFGAIAAALDNVHRHAGTDAHAWVLVEDDPDEVIVSVRDDGPGIAEGRLAEAVAAGRLGVAQSMLGRVDDLGGTAEITSRPGEGTEVEFRIPRRR